MIEKTLKIKKPSSYFFLEILVCLFILILIGNPIWRHVDDFGPLEVIFQAQTIKDYLKIFSYWGWGSYPPIWEYFSYLSYLFKPFGIDAVRFVCFLLGFFSLIISSFLTYSICFYIKELCNSKKIFYFNNNYLEIMSIIFNILNPEIYVHSNSNMPYNLSIITVQLIIILLFNLLRGNNNNLEDNFLSIKLSTFLLITLFSLTFTFQSIIISSAFIITLIIYYYNSNAYIKYSNIFNLSFLIKSYFYLFKGFKNKYIKYSLIFIISFLLLMYGFKIMVIIFYKNWIPGTWTNGIGDIYNNSLKSNNLIEINTKIFFSFKSIVLQALYPLRFGQNGLSLFLSALYFYSLIRVSTKNIILKYFITFIISTFLITILLSIFGNFVFSPTRHTIFLYPLIWIPVFITFEELLLSFRNKATILIIPIGLSFLFTFGCYISIKDISYSKNENIKLLNLLKESDFVSSKYYSFSNIALHGTEEYKLVNSRKCSIKETKNLENYKLFLYSHRRPFINNKKNAELLFETDKKCFPNNYSISVLDSIEIKNNKDIEQNNFIYNGGSNLFAYLLDVKVKR